METSSSVLDSSQAECTRLLPREAFQEITRVLRSSLPAPEGDAPEDWARRDRAAVAKAGALQPVTAAEAELAAQFVSACAWAADCLRLAHLKRREIETARQAKAQAMGMMRESKGTLRALMKLQAQRRAADADGAAGQAEWVEHVAISMLSAGLDKVSDEAVSDELVGEEAADDVGVDGCVCDPCEAGFDEGMEPFQGDRIGARVVSSFAINSQDMARETDPRFEVAARRSGG